jgi:hypothetical protein
MTKFTYTPEELPEITPDASWAIRDPAGKADIVRYYRTDDRGSELGWSFSNLEDADLEYIRASALAWIAWYEFVVDGGLTK